MLIPSLVATFLAGVAGSPHCIGMCGGFAASCAGRDAGLPWHLGRFTTYALLGAAAGAFGSLIPGPGWVAAAVSAVAIIGFSAALAGLLPEPRFRVPGLSRAAVRLASEEGPTGRWLFGMATSALPCGLVYAALAIPVASGSAAVGALSMVVFGLATTPALLVVTIGARRLAVRDLRVRRVLAAAVLVSGLTSIGLRQGLLPGPAGSHMQHAVTAPAESAEGPASTSDAHSPHADGAAGPAPQASSTEDRNDSE